MIADKILQSVNPKSWLCLKRVVRFGDIDAAGVIHFHHLFRWCHESWEESMQIYGVNLNKIFPNYKHSQDKDSIALPIIHCEADYLNPITVGDELDVILLPQKLDVGTFQIKTRFRHLDKDIAIGSIVHVAIMANNRNRCNLPSNIQRWLESSSLGSVIETL